MIKNKDIIQKLHQRNIDATIENGVVVVFYDIRSSPMEIYGKFNQAKRIAEENGCHYSISFHQKVSMPDGRHNRKKRRR